MGFIEKAFIDMIIDKTGKSVWGINAFGPSIYIRDQNIIPGFWARFDIIPGQTIDTPVASLDFHINHKDDIELAPNIKNIAVVLLKVQAPFCLNGRKKEDYWCLTPR